MAGETEGRRWTLTGMCARGPSGDRVWRMPTIDPSLDHGETVEVMPVSEHAAIVAERDRLREVLEELAEAVGRVDVSGEIGEMDDLAEALGCGVELLGERPADENEGGTDG